MAEGRLAIGLSPRCEPASEFISLVLLDGEFEHDEKRQQTRRAGIVGLVLLRSLLRVDR